MHKKCLLLCVLISILCFKGLAQTSSGKEFWFGFPQMSDFPSADTVLKTAVKITSQVSTSGVLEVPGQGYTMPFTVSPGLVTSIIIPVPIIYDSLSDKVKAAAVHITANDTVNVFAFSNHYQRNYSMLVIPTTAFGSEYLVLSNKDFDPSSGGGGGRDLSQFMIVGNGSPVTVEITPAYATRGGHAANVPFIATIAPGEVYQVQALRTGTVTGDFTGSKIVAVNKTDRFSVIGAIQFGQIGCTSSGEPYAAPMLPVNTWGQEYIFPPFPQQSGDICRVLAAKNNTKVYINGALKGTINAGKFIDQVLTANSYICADKPIAVAKFLQSRDCNGNPAPSRGDPSMVVLHANHQMSLPAVTIDVTRADTVAFSPPSFPGFKFYYPIDTIIVQIVTRTADKGTMFLDGVNIGSQFTAVPGNTAFSVANIGVPFGVMNATGTFTAPAIIGKGFLAYVTGEGSLEAYTYSAGMRGNLAIAGALSDTIIPSPGSCYTVGTPIQFKCTPSGSPQSWSWNFGDGTTSTSSVTPTHTYSTTGSKTVSLTMTYACYSKTATYTIPVCAPAVPVDLLEFTVRKNNNSVLLNWKTANEHNSERFVIERSFDGMNFESIGSVKAAGNSSSVRNYAYTDHSPAMTLNFYRLKQVDNNASHKYSRTINIRLGLLQELSVQPIPAKEYISVNYSGNSALKLKARICTELGQLVKSETLIISSDRSSAAIAIGSLAEGLYFLDLITDEGISQRFKIIKD